MVGKVENIIKNEHQFLHKLYKHYSGLGISDEPELVEKVYTMDVKQFLQLCKVRPPLLGGLGRSILQNKINSSSKL